MSGGTSPVLADAAEVDSAPLVVAPPLLPVLPPLVVAPLLSPPPVLPVLVPAPLVLLLLLLLELPAEPVLPVVASVAELAFAGPESPQPASASARREPESARDEARADIRGR